MAQKLEPNDLVTFKELLMANSIQVDAAVQLMIEKGFFTKDEFFIKLKQVQMEYQNSSQCSKKSYPEVGPTPTVPPLMPQ